MITMILVRKLKSGFLLILSLIRRCFCCFIRSKDVVSLPITNETMQKDAAKNSDDWDDWDKLSSVVSDGKGFKPSQPMISPMEHHILEYRKGQQEKINSPLEVIEEPDLFQELAPRIPKKPQVIIYAHPEEEQHLSNRLFSATDPCFQSSELQDWEENGGWEEEADNECDLSETIREYKEKLRQEKRAERQMKKSQKEEQRRQNAKMAVKMS